MDFTCMSITQQNNILLIGLKCKISYMHLTCFVSTDQCPEAFMSLPSKFVKNTHCSKWINLDHNFVYAKLWADYHITIQNYIRNNVQKMLYAQTTNCQGGNQSFKTQGCHAISKPIADYRVNSSSPGQNGYHFTEDIFKSIFVNEKGFILIKISLSFVSKGRIDDNAALV